MRLARESGDALSELYAANNLVAGYETAGEPARAHEIARAAAVRADELGLVALRRQLNAADIGLDVHAGNYERVIEDGELLLAELVEPRTIDQLLEELALAYVDRGQFKRAAELSDRRGSARDGFVRAELELWAGRAIAAIEHCRCFHRARLSDRRPAPARPRHASVGARRPRTRAGGRATAADAPAGQADSRGDRGVAQSRPG